MTMGEASEACARRRKRAREETVDVWWERGMAKEAAINAGEKEGEKEV